MENKYKRKYRELDNVVKAKISQANKNKPKSAEHKMHISQSMEKYWQSVPNREDVEGKTTIEDIV